MARYTNPGKRERRDWEAWVASRPLAVREVAERVDPWTLYRIRSTGQRGVFYGLRLIGSLDIYVAVEVTPQFNLVLAGTARLVVTSIDDLEPCQLPAPGERVGLLDVQPNPGGGVTLH